MTPAGDDAQHPILIRLHPADFLEGPPSDLPRSSRREGCEPVTGGGLAGMLDPSRGLAGLWDGGGTQVAELTLEVEGHPAPSAPWLRTGAGGWSREIILPGGNTLLEHGLLPDAIAGAVLQWSLVRGSRMGGPARGDPLPRQIINALVRGPQTSSGVRTELSIGSDEPTAVAILPAGADAARAAEILRPLRARELQRANRGTVDGATLSLHLNGAPSASVTESLRDMDDASLSLHATATRFLAGIVEEAPLFLRGTLLADFALASLAAGRRPLAHGALSALSLDPDFPGQTLLELADRWMLWTGDAGALAPLRGRLGRGEALASMPGARPGWLVDRPGPPAPPASRTVRAARILRRWVEGRLGARPDAPYGRLRLAPEVTSGWKSLRVQALSVGDGAVSLDYQREGGSHSFVLRQETGRVPLQLIFEPQIAGAEVDRVLIGGAVASVDILPGPRGTRIRCQFPLDPERRLTILERG